MVLTMECTVHRLLLALGLAFFSAAMPTSAQPDLAKAHLVLSFSRGPLSPNGLGATHSSVVMPMPSMTKCREEGNKAITRNTKEVRTVFWCIES